MLFVDQVVDTGSENTKDPIHKLWKRDARNLLLSVSISQFNSVLMQTSTLWTQKRLVVRLTFSGLHSQERMVPLYMD